MTCSQFSRGFSENLPRPPVPGSGGGDGDNDTCHHCHHSAKPDKVHASCYKVSMSDQYPMSMCSCETAESSYFKKQPESVRSYEPDGCARDLSSKYEEHSNPSPSLVNLRLLLDDSSGISHFLNFLTATQHSEILEFWLACSGFRKVEERKLRAVAMVIFKKFLYRGSNKLGIRNQTKQVVRDKLKCTKIDLTIFDEAVLEVETVLCSDYLPQFLISKDYLEYVRSKSASASPTNPLSSSAGQMSPCSCRDDTIKCCDHLPRCHGELSHQTFCTATDRLVHFLVLWLLNGIVTVYVTFLGCLSLCFTYRQFFNFTLIALNY